MHIYIYIYKLEYTPIYYNTHTHTIARGAISAQIAHAVQHIIGIIHAQGFALHRNRLTNILKGQLTTKCPM